MTSVSSGQTSSRHAFVRSDPAPDVESEVADDAVDPAVPAVGFARHGKSGWAQLFTGRHRLRNRTVGVLLALVVLLLVDAALLDLRINTVGVRMPSGGTGETFVVVGSDSRADLPPGASTSAFGSTTEVPGQRADVVLVVHRRPDGSSSTLSIPRDMLITEQSGAPVRLALTLTDGAQALVDGLCTSLGIRTDHLITVDFDAFDTVVDGVGGVQIDLPAPTRDSWTGLDLEHAGQLTLTGTQALALVRSRHPEELHNGVWVAQTNGAAQRTDWAGVVFTAVRASSASVWKNPLRLQQLAWRTTGVLTTDDRTSLWDLARLSTSAGAPVDLPGRLLAPSALPVMPTEQTHATLARAGIDGTCRPAD